MENQATARARAVPEATADRATPQSLSKVAAVGLSFWILKTLLTTAGDLCGDALSISLHLGYTLALGVAVAATGSLLLAQIRARRFQPLRYWALILGSSATGAEVSDSSRHHPGGLVRTPRQDRL
jgi:uncharacterized membrane-anchored protein